MDTESLPKVFIVDDLALVLHFLHENLIGKVNAEIVIFDNPLDAISKIKDGIIPLVVITDYMMPEMDGIELLTRIEMLLPSIKGVIMSAEPQRVRELNSKWDVIEKIQIDLFCETIRDIIRKYVDNI